MFTERATTPRCFTRHIDKHDKHVVQTGVIVYLFTMKHLTGDFASIQGCVSGEFRYIYKTGIFHRCTALLQASCENLHIHFLTTLFTNDKI